VWGRRKACEAGAGGVGSRHGAGASALGSSDESAAGAAKAGAKVSRNADGVLFKRDGRNCDREHRMRSGSASSYAPSDF
jgi:hypothetical protein